MKIKETPLKDCYIIEPTVFEDERGYFYEKFKEKNLPLKIKSSSMFQGVLDMDFQCSLKQLCLATNAIIFIIKKQKAAFCGTTTI